MYDWCPVIPAMDGPTLLAGIVVEELIITYLRRRAELADYGPTEVGVVASEQVAGYLADSPYGTVLYDHWLSWELRYYLFDSRVYVSWFPDAAALVSDLQSFGADPPRYLVVPAWEDASPILQDARAAGFGMQPVFHATKPDSTSSFIVYTITH